ncbi:hypothetical protein TNCV_277611 [Trichonephila clavipes]|uniref:Uncharacterized protein n=1 Tax=Trichonephila clavipes TaxID=2585209 RepID=A0A8X6S5H2_TRICX|nr:hypothetical protein TNCV_277611 [Trichonephila clavipes]
MSPIRLRYYIITSSRRKIWQQLPGLEALLEKKGVVSYKDLLIINGTKYSHFPEAARSAGLSKSEEFINEVLDDAASVTIELKKSTKKEFREEKSK